MTPSFNDIHTTYQDILLLINETLDRALSSASIVLFSFWFIGGGIGFSILSTSRISEIVSSLLILWMAGFIIILIPGILEYLLRFIFRRILIDKHYSIISKLEKEYYELEEVKQISYILHSAIKLKETLKKDGVLFYIFIHLGLYLEKRGLIMSLRGGYKYTKEMNEIILCDARNSIEKKKQILFSLITKIKIMEAEVMKQLLIDLRSDLSIRLTEQQKLLESARSEIDSNIRGTSELVNVSELQQTRLDRQIEQFEELQKILVKV